MKLKPNTFTAIKPLSKHTLKSSISVRIFISLSQGDIDGDSEQSHNEYHSVCRILTRSTSGVRAVSFGLVTDCGRPLMTNTLPSLTDEQFLSQ